MCRFAPPSEDARAGTCKTLPSCPVASGRRGPESSGRPGEAGRDAFKRLRFRGFLRVNPNKLVQAKGVALRKWRKRE